MSYQINGVDVDNIIQETNTVTSLPGYVDFPVTTNSVTERSNNTTITNNQIPTSGQTSYGIGTNSLDMKFPYNISPGTSDSDNMAYYCQGVSHSLTGEGNLDTSNFKHISIQGTSGTGGGAGGGGGGTDNFFGKKNSGGRGGNGGMPGFISVIDYPLSTNTNTIEYNVGTAGSGGAGGNRSTNSGKNGKVGEQGGSTTVKIDNTTFTANGGGGANDQGGSGNTNTTGTSHNNMAAPGTGQYYDPNNGITVFTFDPNCTTSGGGTNYTSGKALINNTLLPGNNTQTTNEPIGFPRYTTAMQNTSNGYSKDILVKFGTPITSKYLAPGNGGAGQKGDADDGEDGTDGTLSIWLKNNPNSN